MIAGPRIEQDGTHVVVRIPMQMKKRGGRTEVLVPDGLGEELQSAAQEPLVTALARAFAWQDLIDSGHYPSIAALADALRVDRSYVRRILTLATLAPDIIETIVAGREPSGLSLERMTKKLPMNWEEQRARFGFTR